MFRRAGDGTSGQAEKAPSQEQINKDIELAQDLPSSRIPLTKADRGQWKLVRQVIANDGLLIVGANDVVNPAANTDPQSPIFGMPILEVNHAKKIIIVKRSMSAGYAGIDNELFFDEKTSMLFGDAKAVITDLVSELKNM